MVGEATENVEQEDIWRYTGPVRESTRAAAKITARDLNTT